jgi:hypothetical protein
MDAQQLFATGGVSGVTALCFYLIYRFLFTKHRIASKCCGREMSIDVEVSPKDNPINNIKVPVDGPIERRSTETRTRTTEEG